MEALGQLVLGKRRAGAAEGRFAGNVSGAFPTAESAERGPGMEGFEERAGGGELIDVFGDAGVGQPDAGTGRTALAAPLIAAGEAAQLGQRDDLAELLVQGGEFAQFPNKANPISGWLTKRIWVRTKGASGLLHCPAPPSRAVVAACAVSVRR